LARSGCGAARHEDARGGKERNGARICHDRQPIMTEAKGTITVRPNGPYRVEGGVPLEGADGKTFELKPAYSLCRCGKSANKPYCDGTHKECGFDGTEIADPNATAGLAGTPAVEEALLIRVVRDGPYEVVGAPTLTYSDGRICETTVFYRLCRCGASKNKPFCDDSHLEAGFRSP
ncbi:MAG TPA: CDGSH iron-sulfur domain-containing protein, partial [Thermoanaerobaculia bacterium]|nr:CDGSH iron-sulfur domain-containing protein [Thermoanaerobaculia bacterium]